MKDFDESYEIEDVVRDEKGDPVRRPDGSIARRTVTVRRGDRLTDERSFTIGGQTFQYRVAVAPEGILRWAKMVGGEYKKDEVILDEKGDPKLLPGGAVATRSVSTLSEEQALEIFDETVLAFLAPGQEEKWREARRPDHPNPLSMADLGALVEWLFEESSGRPTVPPSVSSNGHSDGGTSSTESSPSRTAAPA